MNLKQKIKNIAFYSTLGLVLLQSCLVDIEKYQFFPAGHQTKEARFLFINKLSFGLNLPFLNKKLLNWGTPAKEDHILFRNKFGKISIGEVISVEGEVITIGSKREMLPEGYFYVKETNSNQDTSSNFGFIKKDVILGRIFL